jgi:hypothetical protein
VAKFLLLNFSMKVLEMLSLCDNIPHQISYLNILNANQYISDSRFLVFLTVHGYLMIFLGDANLLVQRLMQKESKCVAISRLSLIFYELKALNCFYL